MLTKNNTDQNNIINNLQNMYPSLTTKEIFDKENDYFLTACGKIKQSEVDFENM